MLQAHLKNKLLLIHAFLGILLVYTPRSSHLFLGVLLLIGGLYYIALHNNKKEEAFFFSFYFMSAEVFFRMTKSLVFWEFGKYAVMVSLLFGLLVEKKKKGVPFLFILYLLIMLIGVVFTEIPYSASYRKVISFNLTGPVTLGISAIYFYKRKISFTQLKDVFFVGILPVVSMVVYLYFRTPSLKEMVFNSAANFSASGGFGPNQVATSLGFGIFLTAVLLVLKYKITPYKMLDFGLLFYIIFRGLLTFSRGGLLTGVLSFFLFILFYLLKKDNKKELFKVFTILFILISGVWIYSSNITGGMLNNRFLGRNTVGEQKDDISSGRTDIIEDQLNNFYESPIFGLGVGSGDYRRKEKYEGKIMSTSHNEVGRLIEEHGLLGILSLLLLFVSAFKSFLSHELVFKGFIVAFAALWFLTINHSAMRIAFPGFIYGLSLITLYHKEEEEGLIISES